MTAETAQAEPTGPSRSDIDQTLRAILRDVLGLDQDQVDGFDHETGLFGHLPELDSMAVASLLTEMEDRRRGRWRDAGELRRSTGVCRVKGSRGLTLAMYSTWPCPRQDGSMGEEMVLGFDGRREKRLLIVPPLFDESNKFRHQIFEIMRNLDVRGIDCFLPDLPGCNESLAPLDKQSLAHWQTSITAAATHFSTTEIFAVRSGCWLVPNEGVGWLYAPVRPQQVLRNMLRARALSAREAGREESTVVLMEAARTNGIELAGWQLGPHLITELEGMEFTAPPGYVVIDQTDIGGKALWLRAENDYDPAQANAIATMIDKGLPGA